MGPPDVGAGSVGCLFCMQRRTGLAEMLVPPCPGPSTGAAGERCLDASRSAARGARSKSELPVSTMPKSSSARGEPFLVCDEVGARLGKWDQANTLRRSTSPGVRRRPLVKRIG
jgi:hypothetical protein